MDSNEHLLSVLTREGVLIKVGISYWRGNKKLRPEDIGLERKALSERLISLGHKRLLPRDCLQELALIEGRAHALIDYHTFPFLNGLGHFLPNAKVEDVMGRLEGLEREVWAAKGAFLDRYASLRESASREWRVMAENLVKNPDELVETIEQSFPYPSRMERYYAFNIQCFQIALPEGLAAEMVAAGDQRAVVEARQRAAVEAQSRIREEVETFVGDCVASLREQTAVLCEEMLGSINGSENGVHQKTLNRLVRFIDQFKGMNFANDRVMEEQLEQVRRELLSRTAGEYRDSATARARLKQGLSRLASGARQLAGQETAGLVQRFGELGRRKFNLAA